MKGARKQLRKAALEISSIRGTLEHGKIGMAPKQWSPYELIAFLLRPPGNFIYK
jgi:hypothetical protein